MGNIITDCMMSEHNEKGLKADVTMYNAGSIRAAISKGPVTASDVYTISPFGNTIVQFKWTGAQIMETLERVANGQDKNGHRLISLPVFHGLRYTLKEGPIKTIANVTIAEAPLDLQKTYEILTIDFIADGGDNIMTKVDAIPGDLLAEQLVRCLRRQPTISPKLDGRFLITPA
jgi:5'-nucleotidase